MSKTVGAGPPSGGEAQTITVSAFAETMLDDADAPTVRSTIGAGTSSFSGAYNDLTGKPTLFDGNYNSLTNQPVLLQQADIDAAKAAVWPVGSVFISVVSTNPATLLGFGTWSAFGAGKVMVGLDSGDTDFDTVEETGGAKTKAVSAHSGTAVADHAAHTHSVTSNVAVADHASHTHTYTQVPNHVHSFTDLRGLTTGSATTTRAVTEGSDTSSTATGLKTGNPDGGVATGTTNGPSATLTHGVTNNAVTSGNPSATLTHSVTQPSDHTAINVVQPYIVCYFFKRTA